MARIMGMSDDQAEACMNSTGHDAAINKMAQEARTRYQIPGTPTFVIDFKGASFQSPTWDAMQKALDAALATKGVK